MRRVDAGGSIQGERRREMTTIPHEPVKEKRSWQLRLLVPEMWAFLAIVAMWLAVLVAAVYGPDIVSINSTPGGTSSNTTIPSAVVVALFAFLGTWVVARHGLHDERKESAEGGE
jgi:hypothetical protein